MWEKWLAEPTQKPRASNTNWSERERAKKKSTPLSHALMDMASIHLKTVSFSPHITEEFFSSQVSDVSRVLEVLYASGVINRDGMRSNDGKIGKC